MTSNKQVDHPVIHPPALEICFQGEWVKPDLERDYGTESNQILSLKNPQNNKTLGTPSLEIRPIFLSSRSIDIFQRGTYGDFLGLAYAQ